MEGREGLTTGAVARQLGVTSPTVCKWLDAGTVPVWREQRHGQSIRLIAPESVAVLRASMGPGRDVRRVPVRRAAGVVTLDDPRHPAYRARRESDREAMAKINRRRRASGMHTTRERRAVATSAL